MLFSVMSIVVFLLLSLKLLLLPTHYIINILLNLGCYGWNVPICVDGVNLIGFIGAAQFMNHTMVYLTILFLKFKLLKNLLSFSPTFDSAFSLLRWYIKIQNMIRISYIYFLMCFIYLFKTQSLCLLIRIRAQKTSWWYHVTMIESISNSRRQLISITNKKFKHILNRILLQKSFTF